MTLPLSVLSIAAATLLGLASTVAAQERRLVGYASPMTVRPGDTVEFKVSTVKDDALYQAELVKVINGDSLTR